MKIPFKRIVSLVCVLAMCVAVLPTGSLADEAAAGSEPTSSVTTDVSSTVQTDETGTADTATDTETDPVDADQNDPAASVPETDGTEGTTAVDGAEGTADSTAATDSTPAADEETTADSEPAVDDESDTADSTAADTEAEADSSENTPAEAPDTTPSAGPNKVAPLAENPVAKIGDTEYDTLDEAVEAAAEGSTIELLQDCELTKGFNKTLTFTGTGKKITINKQLTSNGEGWMCFGLYDPSRVLTFDGVKVEWTSEVETSPWLMLSLSGTLNVTNGAEVAFTVDSGSSGNRNAIYMNEGSVINVTNGSHFVINGYDTTGKEGQGIQLDKTGLARINVTGNSTFEINGTNRGYVNSPAIYVEDSTFTVQNCTANASNGGNFTAVNSTINYLNNTGHGLSADDVILKNSTFTADKNGYYGVRSGGKFLVDSTSTLTVTGNSYGGDYAGLKLTSGVTDGKVEAGAVVTITGNYCSGLSNNGKCTFAEGAKLTIMNNTNNQGTSSYGGGVYNSGAAANLTLPSDAVIYNNHTKTAGDDIFNNTTATITFGKVGEGWVLDGNPDCTDTIDGWYDDGRFNGATTPRWNAHVQYSLHMQELTGFETGSRKVTGQYGLKAAHGLLDLTLQPADITIYMGGDNGYEGVSESNGTIVGSNSLPEPGYYITLPDEVNKALQAAGLATEGESPANLSAYITLYTEGTETQSIWQLASYGYSYSAALGKYIYAITPDTDATQPLRLTFTDEAGNTYESDTFMPAQEGALHQTYTMDLYQALLQQGTVLAKMTLNGTDYFFKVGSVPGTLDIRYVTGNQDSVVTPVYDSVEQASQADDPNQTALKNAYVIPDPDTKFFINGSQVDVTDSVADVSLLFDDVVTSANTEGMTDYTAQLRDQAIATAAQSFENVQYQAKYLDLVDANNGNVWLTASKPVTVYWPYPAGTDANTTFYLVHFDGMDREMGNEEIANAIGSATKELIPVTADAYGISFTADSFSPYVLLWDVKTPASSTPSTTTPAATPAPTTAPVGTPATGDAMPVALFGGAAILAALTLTALVVVRKRYNH